MNMDSEQLQKLQEDILSIKDAIPKKHQQKYCLLFGKRFMGCYDTREEMTKAVENEYKYIAVTRYYPEK